MWNLHILHVHRSADSHWETLGYKFKEDKSRRSKQKRRRSTPSQINVVVLAALLLFLLLVHYLLQATPLRCPALMDRTVYAPSNQICRHVHLPCPSPSLAFVRHHQLIAVFPPRGQPHHSQMSTPHCLAVSLLSDPTGSVTAQTHRRVFRVSSLSFLASMSAIKPESCLCRWCEVECEGAKTSHSPGE